MGSGVELLTLTRTNNNGNKGLKCQAEESELNGELLRWSEQESVLGGEAGRPAGSLVLSAHD